MGRRGPFYPLPGSMYIVVRPSTHMFETNRTLTRSIMVLHWSGPARASVSKLKPQRIYTKCNRPFLARSTERFSPSGSWKHWSPSFVEMMRCERKRKNASPSRDNSSRIPWWVHPLFSILPCPRNRRRGLLETGNLRRIFRFCCKREQGVLVHFFKVSFVVS